MITVKWVWLKFMVVPYTGTQLSIVMIICLIIGIYLGAMAVGAFKADKKRKSG